VKALQDRTSLREKQLEATRVKVIERISHEADPVISSVYKTHGCGVLFRREAVIGGNPTNDLTPEILRDLDAKLTTIDFSLEAPPAATTATMAAKPTA
jgi:Skp family chaperone for outer membrane proteins